MGTQIDVNCVGLNVKTKLHPMMLSDVHKLKTPYRKESMGYYKSKYLIGIHGTRNSD